MADPPSKPHASHDSTRWSIVEQARSPDANLRQEALGRLLEHYLPSLRAYLVYQMRIDRDQVDDLLQDFVADRVLTHSLIEGANPNRGKFHIFLRMAVRNFVLDHWRRQQAAKRSPDRAIGLADQIADALVERPNSEPDLDEVSHAWQMLVETVERFRLECQEDNRPQLWDLFAERFLQPAAIGANPEQLEQLAQRLGLTNTQVSNLFVTIKRRMQQVLQEVMLQYTAAEQVDEAIAQLQAQLSAAGTWRVALAGLAAPGANATMSIANAPWGSNELCSVVSFLQSDASNQPTGLEAAVEELLETPLDQLVGSSPFAATLAEFARGPRLQELLRGHAGTVETVCQLKDFGKKHAGAPTDKFPREICTWLYYAGIAAAKVHHSRQITSLRPMLLVEGIDWLLAQPWLDGTSRALFESARKQFVADLDQPA